MRSSPEQLRHLYGVMDPSAYESEQAGRKRTAKTHWQIVQRSAKGGALLDVGCASGLFLSLASEHGWKVTGIEPNQALCEDARRNLGGKGEIHCTTLEMASIRDTFDAITAWDVLEHVPDPVGFLRVCRDLLRPNGRLFLNVPDLHSFQARLLRRRWPLLLPEHLNYFNRRNLALCAENAGLVPLKFGRRLAWFSARWVFYRLSQHGLLSAQLLYRIPKALGGTLVVPVSLGETFAVLTLRRSGAM